MKSRLCFLQENPTRIVEAHLIHPDSDKTNIINDFYGDTLRLALIAFVRPEIRFATIDALKTQIYSDVSIASRISRDVTSQSLALSIGRDIASNFISLPYQNGELVATFGDVTFTVENVASKNSSFWYEFEWPIQGM